MRNEQVDRRVLAAVQFVDGVSLLHLSSRFVVRSNEARFIRNQRNLYVVSQADKLPLHSLQFSKQPDTPAPGTVAVPCTVTDPEGQYLPRSFQLMLPRDPDPANAAKPESLFRPVEVALYATPASGTVFGSAVIRATVHDAASVETGLPFALIEVVEKATARVLARGMADKRGEALIGVPGIPITTWERTAGTSVLSTITEVEVQAFFDPQAVGKDYLPDPDQLRSKPEIKPSGKVQEKLSFGQEFPVKLPVTLT